MILLFLYCLIKNCFFEKKYNNNIENNKKLYNLFILMNNPNYDQIKSIGEGSFGKVYLIKRKSDDFICILKKIEFQFNDQKEKDKALKEVEIMKKLNHPNLIKLHDCIIEKKDIFIIMNYADGF